MDQLKQRIERKLEKLGYFVQQWGSNRGEYEPRHWDTGDVAHNAPANVRRLVRQYERIVKTELLEDK